MLVTDAFACACRLRGSHEPALYGASPAIQLTHWGIKERQAWRLHRLCSKTLIPEP
ncbi:hypothetical protein EMIT0P44_340041 [Pseudomonas sp. IT-P44]